MTTFLAYVATFQCFSEQISDRSKKQHLKLKKDKKEKSKKNFT